MDLVKISSPNKNSATFIYQNIEKKKLQFSIVPICYATFDIDNLIYWINKHFENTFISIPSPKKFELELAPPERKEKLERVEVPDQSVGCGGFELTYLSVCNFLKQEVQDRMLWEIQNFYYPNKIKEFNIKDLIPKPKFPNPEFQACVQSLYYNTWFKQFISNGIILRDESAQMLARVFSTNKTFNELVLTDAGLTKVGIGYLIAAFLENPNINIEKLDLSGNSIDLKVLKEFMECVTGALAAKLTHLDISNLQIPRHGLKLVFDSLGGTVSLVNALTHLKISKNKLDSESSSRLGVFLSLTRALTTFHISATTPNFKNVVASMMVGDKSLSNLTVTELDCSFNVPAKERPEFLQFLKNFPNLTDLNISGTTITVEELISVLKVDHSISKLNVSENNFTDQEIIEFAKFLATPENSIKTLLMNKVWRRATPDRPKAIEQLVNALNNSKIEEFQLKGDRGSSALRDDLIDLIFGLLTNQNLKIIDVSGHQAGDDLAIALSKVLARNSVLHTIYWDFNEISLSGLQAVKLGLNRNYSIRHLELPFMDIFELRNRLDAPEKDVLVTTIQEIQKIVSEISQKATLSSSKKPAGIPTGITYSQIHKASIYFRQSKMMATMEEKPEPKT
uniref:Uncharacterized protein n=1 Tax=Arcella intermedia TaxID=1963864 RepID=A0A6B2KZZ1_9EUKA